MLVRKDKARFLQRLADMKRLGGAAKAGGGEQGLFAGDGDDDDDAGGAIKYSARNNLVPVYLADDGRLWLRNAKFWNSLKIDLTPFGPATEPDEVVVALYPPTASARRSLLAREFIGWLGSLVGREKIHELRVWTDAAAVSPGMQRLPATIRPTEIEKAVKDAGGHYPHGEVRRYHVALNFLEHKHFV